MSRFFNHLKISRLLAMHPVEIVYRMRQEIFTRFDKVFYRKRYLKQESVDAFLRRHVLYQHKKDRGNIALTVFNKFFKRDFFPWQEDVQGLLKLFDDEYLDDKMFTIQRAKDLLQKRFFIFGRTHQFQNEIDWHFDIFEEKSIPLVYYKDINYWDSGTVREVKYVWELNRHQHFVTMAKAYLFTGNETYAQELFSRWEHWIEKNPFKYGINWTSSLEAAFRLISWTWALQMVKNSRHFTPLLYIRILQSIEQHALFIEGKLSLYSSANNHLLGEALGLYYAGCYYPELHQSTRWCETGYRLFCREFPEQVFEDGVIKEQSLHYQQYNFYFALLFKIAIDFVNESLPNITLNRLENMAHFISSLMDSRGNVPDIGDQDGGCVIQLDEGERTPFKNALNTAAVLFKRSDFKCSGFTQGSLWLCGMSGYVLFNSFQTPGRTDAVRRFPYGGYIVIRKPVVTLPQTLCFDCGPLGLGRLAAHGHADALSVWWSVDGEPVLRDSGTYLYLGAGQWRDYFRGTSAHNTLRVDGLDQSEIQGPFQWGRRAKAELIECTQNKSILMRARHNGYSHLGVYHERAIEFKENFWIIRDILHGRGRHTAELFFHLGECTTRLAEQSVLCRFRNLQVTFHFLPQDVKISVEKGGALPVCGWQSYYFGEKHESTVIRAVIKKPCPTELITTMKVEQ
ncbi:alginate lyase family protein [candidate division KSB1 bacterium]|nr:alginate lyase family protein [candidate division KSB1 bacterium]